MDEIAPQLKGKHVASMKIEFEKNEDPTGMRVMYSPARWVQELYPVDEMLAQEAESSARQDRRSTQFEPAPKAPTYRVHAFDAAGKEILAREFTVTTVDAALQRRDRRNTSRCRWTPAGCGMESGAKVRAGSAHQDRHRGILGSLSERDAAEGLPLRDVAGRTASCGRNSRRRSTRLKIDIHMSEPDYNLGLDKERISSLEALQEDTFYSTENFVNMMGDLESGPADQLRRPNHSDCACVRTTARTGACTSSSTAKPAANPMVRAELDRRAGQAS